MSSKSSSASFTCSWPLVSTWNSAASVPLTEGIGHCVAASGSVAVYGEPIFPPIVVSSLTSRARLPASSANWGGSLTSVTLMVHVDDVVHRRVRGAVAVHAIADRHGHGVTCVVDFVIKHRLRFQLAGGGIYVEVRRAGCVERIDERSNAVGVRGRHRITDVLPGGCVLSYGAVGCGIGERRVLVRCRRRIDRGGFSRGRLVAAVAVRIFDRYLQKLANLGLLRNIAVGIRTSDDAPVALSVIGDLPFPRLAGDRSIVVVQRCRQRRSGRGWICGERDRPRVVYIGDGDGDRDGVVRYWRLFGGSSVVLAVGDLDDDGEGVVVLVIECLLVTCSWPVECRWSNLEQRCIGAAPRSRFSTSFSGSVAVYGLPTGSPTIAFSATVW